MVVGRAPAERGFTLTELMVVVVLISVLSVLAFPSMRKRLEQARGRLGVIELRAIAAAQERFRAENLVYLDVSSSLTDYFPVAIPNGSFRTFRDPNKPLWEVLGPTITELTPYVFATRAGIAGETLPADIDPLLLGVMPSTPFPANANTNQWFVVQGRGDVDADGVPQVMLTSSFDPTIYLAQEGE
jgi:prepilin-type N-terminal cleavage/methylation domain-containing protein